MKWNPRKVRAWFVGSVVALAALGTSAALMAIDASKNKVRLHFQYQVLPEYLARFGHAPSSFSRFDEVFAYPRIAVGKRIEWELVDENEQEVRGWLKFHDFPPKTYEIRYAKPVPEPGKTSAEYPRINFHSGQYLLRSEADRHSGR